jgi:hypothetical protein
MPFITKAVFKAIGVKMRAQFDARCQTPMEIQLELFQNLIRKNQDTAFGKDHYFSKIRSFRDFQRNVPISSYETLRPYIERAMVNKPGQLTREAPVFFANTSGTTGKSKWIPVTLESRRYNTAVTRLWISMFCQDHPGILSGRFLAVVSPVLDPPEIIIEGEAPKKASVPCGAESGILYRRVPWVVRRHYSSPYDVFSIPNYEAKYYALVRIAAKHSISFISACNPNTVLLLARDLGTHTETIIEDVRNGGIRKSILYVNSNGETEEYEFPVELRRMLRAQLPPAPRRSKELERAAKSSEHGLLVPRDIWPGLAAIGCWKGGTVGSYVNHFGKHFAEETPVRDLGYLASELRGSVPLSDTGDAGVLTIDTNLYEFLPESARENPNGSDLLSADQLKQGERYYVYVTTRAGLYRYDMHDIIEVVDFHYRTPCIRFLQKGGGIVSLVGEKLTETQVQLAAAKALAGMESKCNFVTACGQMSNGDSLDPHYILVVEFSDLPADASVQTLADRFDAALCDVNIEYHDKRASRRLGPAVLRAVPNGFLRDLRKRRHDAGIPDGQFKVLRVTIDPVFAAPYRGARDFVAKSTDGDRAGRHSVLL